MERRKDSKGKVLKEGESERKDGSYQYRWTDEFGKRNTVYAGDLKILREKENEINKSKVFSLKYVAGTATVMELAIQYNNIKKNALRRKTLYNNSLYLKWLATDEICKKQIKDVTEFDAKCWAKRLYEEQGKSYNTIGREKSFIQSAFEMAINDRRILNNPFSFKLASVVPNNQKHRQPLTDSEYANIIKYVNNSVPYKKYIDIIIVLHETGIRVGELCGLTIPDIDFKNGCIKINKQLVGSNANGVYIEKPKTEAGNRIVPMTLSAQKSFRNIIESRPKLEEEPVVDGVSEFLLINKNGHPRPPWDIASIFKHIRGRYEKVVGEPAPLITPHVLRHTFCSNMIKRGMNVKEVQYLMGHSTCIVTLNIYTHADVKEIASKLHEM